MNRVHTIGAMLALFAASVAFVPLPANTISPDRHPEDPVLTIGIVAKQLGVTVLQRPDEEFVIGSSFTGLLAEPAQLARFGIQMHSGARVTAGRATVDRIRVEADEFEPVPARASATLRADAKGNLVVVPKT